ncbi:unnamed protein product [Bursaphelenchus xylophilus]|uniref:(pine wood nematode) hypothetical protein n=1 Tax=Bursaphelenchus xylophilus TaxID=6326 RepID=A0A7I8X4T3_BURXY|nr:unnamed protein product [Bursaphelenchus xylophilus]CAG9129239.1 unnamed protein product [Bursaphelenchus xylophilus]
MTDKDTVLILFDIFFFLAGVVGSGTAFYFLDKRMDRQRKEKIEKILDMEIQLGKLKATAVAEEEVIGHIKKVGEMTKEQAELIFEMGIQDVEGNLKKFQDA